MAEAKQYMLEPPFGKKFRRSKAQEAIALVLKQRLTGVAYHAENTSAWAREIADEIKLKLKGENWARYKFVVQVVIGEERGEAVRMACKCLWDTNTDDFAQQVFTNESLFCVAAAFGMYVY